VGVTGDSADEAARDTTRCCGARERTARNIHPGGIPGAHLQSISHRCHPILVAFVWELTEETIDLPLGCLQGGQTSSDQLCESSGTKERLHGSLPDRTWRRRIPRHFWRVEIPEPGPLARCQERQLPHGEIIY